MKSKRIIELLIHVGLPEDLLLAATDGWRLRNDLGLSSAETLHLQMLLEQIGCKNFSLWDTYDYSLEELEFLINLVSDKNDFPYKSITDGLIDSFIGINQRLEISLRNGGNKLALASVDETLSYTKLMSKVFSTAVRLRELHINKGDRIAFQLPNCVDAVVLMLASLMVGAVPVPILMTYRARELRHIFDKTGPLIIAVTCGNLRFSASDVVDNILREKNSSIIRKLVYKKSENQHSDWFDLHHFCSSFENTTFPDNIVDSLSKKDIAMMLLSSGTTGLPKAIARFNEGYSYMIEEGCKVFELTNSSVYLAVLPIAHGFVINCPGILGTLSRGGTVILAPDSSAQTSLDLVLSYGVTHTTLVPTILNLWIEYIENHPLKLFSLKCIQVGGSRLSADLALLAESKLSVKVQQCYGMSEGLLCFTRKFDDVDTRYNSQGKPLSDHDEILIVDEKGSPVPTGVSGELITKGPYTITQYFNDPDANLKSFTLNGYYKTGDLAHLDELGNVYIDGRVIDVINRSGEKFIPEEIEELLKTHPDIVDAACVGIPDSKFGEVPCLFLTLNKNNILTLSDIRRYLEKKGIASFKLPEKIFFLDEIPRKGIGKIDRLLLRNKMKS